MSWNTYLLIVVLWSAYLLLHSLLASQTAKDWAYKNLRIGVQLYRLLYSLISTIGIFYIFYQMLILPSYELFLSPGWLKYVSMILASWGVIILVVSFRYMSGLAFIGLKKEAYSGLITDGLHGYMRHPIYSGTILILIGMFFYHPTDVILISNLVIFIYLPFGIYWEEQKLIGQFGDEYLEYKKEVPALIPRLRR